MSGENKHRLTGDEILRAADEYRQKQYKYEAFISYRHVEPDQSIARALHEMIETFKAPREFNIDGRPLRFRVFRDREELAVGDLSDSIEQALENSKYLIIICSGRWKHSEWCRKELSVFRRFHGDNNIIPVLVEGDPDESFPEELKNLKRYSKDGKELNPQDILAADIRPDRVLEKGCRIYAELEANDNNALKKLTRESVVLLKTEKYRIMAAILGCAFGDLKQRDKERKNRLALVISSTVGACLLAFGIFMFNAYSRAEEARKAAVQSNTSILLKAAEDLQNNGDNIKAVLVAQEAMKPINDKMEHYEALKLKEMRIFNDATHHAGVSMLTTVPTKNRLTYFSLSKDGNYLAYGLGSNQVGVSNTVNGELLKTFSGHSEQVKLTAFSPDTRYIASASFDRSIVIHDFETGETAATLKITGTPMLMRFSGDGSRLLHISFDQNKYIFNTFNTLDWSKEAEQIITEDVRYADFNENGEEILLVLGGNIGEQLTRRDIKTGNIIVEYPRVRLQAASESREEMFASYSWAKYSADGQSIIAEADGRIIKYSMGDAEIIFIVNQLSDNKSGGFLIETGNSDKILVRNRTGVNILDGNTGEEIENIYFEDALLTGFAYDERYNTILVAKEDETIAVWRDGVIIENSLKYGDGIPTELMFLPDGSKAVTSVHDNQTIKIIDTAPLPQSQSIQAQIISVSQDASKILMYDGTDMLVLDDLYSEPEKIYLSYTEKFSYISETRDYRISNDGRLIARRAFEAESDTSNLHFFINVYNIDEDRSVSIPVSSSIVAFDFTPDSMQILISGEDTGMCVADVNTGKILKKYEDIQSSSYKMLIGNDGKTVIINRLSGTADIYNLSTGELIDKIPGEVLYASGEGDFLEVTGIHNNSGFRWSKNTGSVLFDLDDACMDTPTDFGDVNLYNKENDILLMVRNNDIERVCYIVDFKSGELLMTLHPSLKRYRVNGYISPDGKSFAVDQYFYMGLGLMPNGRTFRQTAIYSMGSEEDTIAEAAALCAGRRLTVEEKEKIGINEMATYRHDGS